MGIAVLVRESSREQRKPRVRNIVQCFEIVVFLASYILGGIATFSFLSQSRYLSFLLSQGFMLTFAWLELSLVCLASLCKVVRFWNL